MGLDPEVITFAPPDVEALVIAHLTAHPRLGGVAVTGEVEEGFCLRVTRTGGPTDVRRRRDLAEVQLDSYGPRDPGAKSAVNATIRNAIAAVHELTGYFDAAVAVPRTEPGIGPRWQPEADGRPRYVASVLIHAVPVVPTS